MLLYFLFRQCTHVSSQIQIFTLPIPIATTKNSLTRSSHPNRTSGSMLLSRVFTRSCSLLDVPLFISYLQRRTMTSSFHSGALHLSSQSQLTSSFFCVEHYQVFGNGASEHHPHLCANFSWEDNNGKACVRAFPSTTAYLSQTTVRVVEVRSLNHRARSAHFWLECCPLAC